MIDSDALTTLQAVKDYLGITSNADDALLESFINRVTDSFEAYCARKFKSASYTEYHDGKGSDKLFPKQAPITTVTSIYDDSEWAWGASTLIASTEYRIVDEAYIQLKSTTFMDDVQNVKITYTAGYSTIPADVEHACIEQAAWLYRKSKGQLQGVAAKSLADGSISYSARDLLPELKLALEPYRRRKLA